MNICTKSILMFFFSFCILPLFGQDSPCESTIPLLEIEIEIVGPNLPGDPNIYPGDDFCINLRANNFTNLSLVQFVLNFDPTVIELDDPNLVTLGALSGDLIFNEGRKDQGILNILWFDNFLTTDGSSLNDGDIFLTICFEAQAAGDCSQLFEIDGAVYNPPFATLVKNEVEGCVMDSIIFNTSEVEVCIECETPTVKDLQICNSSGTISFGVCGAAFPVEVDIIGTPFTNEELLSEDDRLNFSNIPSGTYAIELVDAMGNTNGFGDFFDIDRNLSSITIDTMVIDPRCFNTNDGEIQYTLSGGAETSDYTVEVSDGVYYFENPGVISNLSNGTYSLTVTDEAGCSEVMEDITLFTEPLSIDFDSDVFLCMFDDMGTLSICGAGGTPFPGLEYEINNRLGTCVTIDDPMGSISFNEQDTCYMVEVRDQVGCILEECVPIPIENRFPLEFDTIPPGCDDPGYSASLRLSTFPVQGILVNSLRRVGVAGSIPTAGGGDCAFVGFGAGCGAPTSTGNFLSAGDYEWTMQILDPNDLSRILCSETFPFSIPDFSTDPIELMPIGVQPDCGQDNGAITLTATGGNGDYSYRWEFDTLRDNRILSNLPAGIYNVTVTDTQGCTQDTFVDLEQGDFLTVEAMLNQNLDCTDPTLAAVLEAVFNGFDESELTFNWYTENEANLGDQAIFTTDTAATYIVEVSNIAMTCIVTDTIVLGDPGRLTFEFNQTDPAECGVAIPIPGSIEITDIQGGSGMYNCFWELNGIPLPPSTNFDCSRDNLAGGDYFITIVDANGMGCPATLEVSLRQNDDVAFTGTLTSPTCPGLNDGIIAIEGNPGAPDLICTWDDPSITSCVATNLLAGDYNITIEDVNGCSKDTLFSLAEPEIFTASITDTIDISCFGGGDGTATAMIEMNPSGHSTFGYVWSNGDALSGGLMETNSDLPLGPNFVIISDENNCQLRLEFEIGEPEEMNFIAGSNIGSVLCNGECNGSVTLQAMGGTVSTGSGSYSYTWAFDNSSAETRDDLCAGEYLVTISDALGCEKIDTVFIMDTDSLIVEVAQKINIGCQDPGAGGSIQLVTTGGCDGYSYTWTDSVSDTDLGQGLAEGTYSITVTDACDCTAVVMDTISASEPIFAEIELSGPPACQGETVCLGINQNTITGGTGINYTYTIGSGALGGRIPIDSCVQVLPGPTTVSVFDSEGCPFDLGLIQVPGPPEFSVDLGPDIDAEIGAAPIEITPTIISSTEIEDILWTPADGWDCLTMDPCTSISYTATNNVTITVIVTDENGCTTTDELLINLDTPRRVYRPTAFLPDSDIDDKFMLLTGRGVERIENFLIYDRWGNLVFELPDAVKDFPHSKDDGWDGRKDNRDCSPGVYVWIAKVLFSDGQTIDYRGEITLIR